MPKAIIKKNISLQSYHTVALLTDFGLQDQYVASLKGVMLSINPTINIVDITHNIIPQKIKQGAFILWSAYKYFPKGTIFCCIIDPTVGSKRKIICVRTNDYIFLAPDNGLLDFVLSQEKVLEGFEITESAVKKYCPEQTSKTFHGRDIIAVFAAKIFDGLELKELGESFIAKESLPQFVSSQNSVVHPTILNIDYYGNIITNIAIQDLQKNIKAISVGNNLISREISFYDEAPDNTPCIMISSCGLVEISVKNSNAAKLLNANLDTKIKIYWR